MGNEINYNELFGIEENAESLSGEKEQVVAEPEETDNTDKNGLDEEASDSASDKDNSSANTEENTTTDTKPWKTQENSRYAAARRDAERERDIAIKKAKDDARADADRYINQAVKSLGIRNPFTGKNVETKEELEEYNAKVANNRKNEFIRRSGMSEEEYHSFVDNLPEVNQARLAIERANSEKRASERERVKAAIEEDVKKISLLDPDIKTLEDITRLENYPRMYEKIKRGYTLHDAYLSENHSSISGKRDSAIKQSVLNQMGSKEHLQSTSERGKGSITVPTDVVRAYREFNPNATESEIQKHYNKYLKSKK